MKGKKNTTLWEQFQNQIKQIIERSKTNPRNANIHDHSLCWPGT